MLDMPDTRNDTKGDLSACLEPLFGLHQSAGFVLPRVAELGGTAMAEPYRSLLVHQRDMTRTLEGFFGEQIMLRVLDSQRTAGTYRRRVILWLESSGRPVEYGGISIFLEHYPAPARDLILSGSTPLGAILNQLEIPYISKPQRYIQLGSTATIEALFEMPASDTLFGRCNVLTNPEGQTLAEIVEILPKIANGSPASRSIKPETGQESSGKVGRE